MAPLECRNFLNFNDTIIEPKLGWIVIYSQQNNAFNGALRNYNRGLIVRFHQANQFHSIHRNSHSMMRFVPFFSLEWQSSNYNIANMAIF